MHRVEENIQINTLSGAWELSNEAITPVIFSIQSIWSSALSACTDKHKINIIEEQ